MGEFLGETEFHFEPIPYDVGLIVVTESAIGAAVNKNGLSIDEFRRKFINNPDNLPIKSNMPSFYAYPLRELTEADDVEKRIHSKAQGLGISRSSILKYSGCIKPLNDYHWITSALLGFMKSTGDNSKARNRSQSYPFGWTMGNFDVNAQRQLLNNRRVLLTKGIGTFSVGPMVIHELDQAA